MTPSGSRDEDPRLAKIRADLARDTSDAPVPSAWRDAAAEVVASTGASTREQQAEFYRRAVTLLVKLCVPSPHAKRSFFARCDSRFESSPSAGRAKALRAHNHTGFRHAVLRCLVYRGGRLPGTTVVEMKRRRTRAATLLGRAAELVPELPSRARRDLEKLAKVLRAAKPLHFADSIDRAEWIPQPGRATAQRTLLVRSLCRIFTSTLGSPHPELVAVATTVALGLDPPITAENVRDSLRKVERE